MRVYAARNSGREDEGERDELRASRPRPSNGAGARDQADDEKCVGKDVESGRELLWCVAEGRREPEPEHVRRDILDICLGMLSDQTKRLGSDLVVELHLAV
jgi:hypothetical protein